MSVSLDGNLRPETNATPYLAADDSEQPGSSFAAVLADASDSQPQAGPAPAKEPEHDRVWWWLHDHGLALTRHEQARDLRRYFSHVVVTDQNGNAVDTANMSDDDLLALNQELRGHPVGPPLAAGPLAGPGNPAGLTRAQQGSVTKVDNIIANGAKPHDFEGVRRELRGIETGYDHVTEMKNNVRGLNDAIVSLRGSLNNPNLAPAARAELSATLNRAETTLNHMQAALGGK